MASIIVSDTGPLLCIGWVGLSMIKHVTEMTSGRLEVPDAVVEELRRLGTQSTKPRIRDAADRVLAHAPDLYTVAQDDLPHKRVKGMRAEVEDRERKIANAAGQSVRPRRGKNMGEAEALVLAEMRDDAIVLTTDNAALHVGQTHRLKVATFIHVLAADVQVNGLDPSRASDYVRRMAADTNPGRRHIDPLALTNYRLPPGFLS